jgi:hypothetical protein
MAYDSARNQIVLFGGRGDDGFLYNDTWTWDGTGWTKAAPAHSPPARERSTMAYDPARGQVVLFGGDGGPGNDTWTWDGTDWAQLAPEHSPAGRYWGAVAYDAARGRVVLFGGCYAPLFGDTWTWDGIDWSLMTSGWMRLGLRAGPPGTIVSIRGSGFAGAETVRVTFADSVAGRTVLGDVQTNYDGEFSMQVTIPLNASPGRQRVKAKGLATGEIAKRVFTVS